VGRQIGEGDRTDAFGYDSVDWGVALEGIIELHGLVGDEFGEDVGGEDLGEGAEAKERILIGELVRAGGGFAVSVHEDLAAADDDENHAG